MDGPESGVVAIVRRLAAPVGMGVVMGVVMAAAGCAALAEEGWSVITETEPVEMVSSPSVPEVVETSEESERPETADGCVGDLVGDAVAQWPAAHRDPVTAEQLAIWPLPDVDGDGRDESMVIAEVHCGVTGNCPRLLYLSNDGCMRYGGGLWATWESERVLPKTRHGVHDLEVYLKDGCAGMAGTVSRLGWTGEHYRVRSTIDCECPAGWSDEGSEDEPTEPVERARNPACPG